LLFGSRNPPRSSPPPEADSKTLPAIFFFFLSHNLLSPRNSPLSPKHRITRLGVLKPADSPSGPSLHEILVPNPPSPPVPFPVGSPPFPPSYHLNSVTESCRSSRSACIFSCSAAELKPFPPTYPFLPPFGLAQADTLPSNFSNCFFPEFSFLQLHDSKPGELFLERGPLLEQHSSCPSPPQCYGRQTVLDSTHFPHRERVRQTFYFFVLLKTISFSFLLFTTPATPPPLPSQRQMTRSGRGYRFSPVLTFP